MKTLKFKINLPMGIGVFILLLLIESMNGQECKPDKIAQTTDGNEIELYGGNVRGGGFGSNDKSVYALYISRETKNNYTYLTSVLYEPIESKKHYDDAVNNFLNESNLKNSQLEIILQNGKILKFSSTDCKQFASKLLGSIVAYTVSFNALISKTDLESLQESDLKNFRLVIGGHPYERSFQKENKRTNKLRESFNCVSAEDLFDIQKKNSSELDLTEVPISNYSETIQGEWLKNNGKGEILKLKNGTIEISKMGNILTTGSYKITGNRLVISVTEKTVINEISMFLQDMIILKENGLEETYERIQ